ncbi:hypothetical protein TNCV_614311 [Trichonephila clavipes]|nr:hypothetical protein TNCV_614311 [Trichonephila clavipes]
MSKHRYIEKLTVWCALWAGGIIRLRRCSKTMKATTLQSMVSRYRPSLPTFITELNNPDVQGCGSSKTAQRSLVYADKPQTLDPLEDNIRRVIADIRPQMLGKVIENWTSDWTTSESQPGSLCRNHI